MSSFETLSFETAPGVTLVGSALGSAEAPLVLLLHGGGQTRQSWEETQTRLAEAGFRSIALDQRGHGESSWARDRAYGLHDFAADLAAVVRQAGDRTPLLVGASLGGMASMLAAGEGLLPGVRGIVLVDVVHRPEPEGAQNIRAFMVRTVDGFDTLDAAADAIADYLPHRRRPRSLSGLRRNLRQREDGRWYWHWDPAFMIRPDGQTGTQFDVARLARAIPNIEAPVLLVRGGKSEIVSEALAQEFLRLAPFSRQVVVPGATHMISGDNNDAFLAHVLAFMRQDESEQPLRRKA